MVRKVVGDGGTRAGLASERQVSEQVREAARVFGLELKRRNVGAGVNPSGRTVRFGDRGDADFYVCLPGGRLMDVEVKAEGFEPRKLRGGEKRHFDEQLARLRATHARGGFALWVDDGRVFLLALQHVLQGGRLSMPGYDRVELIPGGPCEP
jgi:hypothetical protein